jgi:crotonobetainyl-CoA:carnitine CoA-transferase CaiB-like acyl-CoA transferase
MLGSYRVLDLTDEGSLICGQILGDLGADVILIEPPQGVRARAIGPFRGDRPDPEGSLYFWSFNRNKRGVTLDLSLSEARDRFRELVKSADIVLESFRPGHLDRLGLGWSSLSEINPGLVMVSITPFGQRGPKAGWEATDLTVTAASGVLFMTGDEDRPPVHVSIPQAYLNAGAEAAVGALIALAARERDGLGQHVDVSGQTAMMMATQSMILAHGWNDHVPERVGGGFRLGKVRLRFVYPCRDGYVNATLLFGAAIGPATRRLFEWIYEEGFCDATTRDKDWIGYGLHLLIGQEPPEELARVIDCVERFTLSHTKAELFDEALRRRVLIVPVSDIADLLRSKQLAARDFWTTIEQGDRTELGKRGPICHCRGSPREPRSARCGDRQLDRRLRARCTGEFASGRRSTGSPGGDERRRLRRPPTPSPRSHRSSRRSATRTGAARNVTYAVFAHACDRRLAWSRRRSAQGLRTARAPRLQR